MKYLTILFVLFVTLSCSNESGYHTHYYDRYKPENNYYERYEEGKYYDRYKKCYEIHE